MADDLIDRCTDALRVARIIEWTRICVPSNTQVVNVHVDGVGGDSWFDELSGKPQNFGRHLPRMSHTGDDLRRLDGRLVPPSNLSRVRVGRTGNVCGNGSHWAHDARKHSSFKGFVAPFVLSSASTPTAVIRRRRYGWGRRRRCGSHRVQGYGYPTHRRRIQITKL